MPYHRAFVLYECPEIWLPFVPFVFGAQFIARSSSSISSRASVPIAGPIIWRLLPCPIFSLLPFRSGEVEEMQCFPRDHQVRSFPMGTSVAAIGTRSLVDSFRLRSLFPCQPNFRFPTRLLFPKLILESDKTRME